MTIALKLYRRHLPDCGDHGKTLEHSKCSCPIWCDGKLNGKRCRQSLKTGNFQRAIRIAERMERPNVERSDLIPCAQPGCGERVENSRCAKHRKGIKEAIDAFHLVNADLGYATKLSYGRILKTFRLHVEKMNAEVHDVQPDAIDGFRAARPISASTWQKELQILRHFFRFCMERKWTCENPARAIAMPRNVLVTDKEPYTQNEVIKIMAACATIGRGPYERLRAAAMIKLLRHTALRISDVATFRRDSIRHGEIFLRTLKNGKVVKLPVHPDLQSAIDVVPNPRGAAGESRFLFWSGNGTTRAAVRDATRTVTAVFKASGVPGAHAHRFRHTLATELLEAGGTLEDVADILGNSPNIVRKHYAKWSVRRQARISSLMTSVFGKGSGTQMVHEHPEKTQSATTSFQ
jgi:site-specific recombinase XerD